MTDRPRCVLDTNVIVSALAFPQSLPRRAFDRAIESGTILASHATLDELVGVLRRPRFLPYITPGEREVFLRAFAGAVETILITERVTICRDVADNKFLDLAISGAAKYLITGDKDFLDDRRVLNLAKGHSVAIVTPRGFLQRR